MAITYLKKSPKTSSTDDTKTREIVENILKDIETSKEEGCKELSKKFDKYEGDVIVSKEKIEKIKKNLDQKTKDDIQFSHERVRKFAEAQLKNYGQDFEVELSDGLFAGQKLIPVNTAGCYVPAGRYAHIASAVMSVTTAKVAGVKNILVCSSPKPGVGVHPSIVYTADLCGADVILNLGGVPAIAAMTNGLFKNPLIDLKLSSNPGPTSINETFDNPTCSKSFTYTLPNESYAVYTLNYSFSPSDISSNSNFIFQLYDFLYLMNYLFNTFTSDFKNSCFWVNSVESINELILYYCNQSGNMSETICSKEFLPFDFLPESPCIVNPSNCLTGKNKYCSSSKNFNNNYCLNYYSNYYNGNQLDATIISNLQNNCKEIYNSSSDPSTLPDSFWNTCGCFLPDNVYTEFLENNNVDFSESTLGNRQCWYLPCINSSVLPSNNPKCPNNNIVNCIQYSYITTENTNTLAEKTTETKKTLQHCNSLHSENVETTTSKENFTSFQKNKSWMYLSISFLIILILSILFCSCSL